MTNRTHSDTFSMVYQSILDSSIAENYELRHFFEDMLKLADWRTGIVEMTPESISRRINLSLDKVLFFLDLLEKPDDQDKSGNDNGRRIIRLDEHRAWGWTIVNYNCYRATRNAEERREYNRRKQAEYRARQKEAGVPGSDQAGQPVTKNNSRLSVAHPTVAQGDGAFDVFWSAFPKKIAKGAAEKAFKKNGCSKCIESILKALELQKGSEQWRRDGGQYIPYPATWLNRQQWNDQPVLSGPAEGNPSINGSRPPGLVQKDIEAVRLRIHEIRAEGGQSHDQEGWHGEFKGDRKQLDDLSGKLKELQNQI